MLFLIVSTIGLAFQVPNLAAQTVLLQKDMPIGIASMFFSQLLGATVFVSVGESVLDNQLVKKSNAKPGTETGTAITETNEAQGT